MEKIIINLTEEEKERLQRESDAVGIPMTRYIPFLISEELKEPTIPEEINYEDKARTVFYMPTDLLEEVDKTAQSLGLSRSGYLTLLFLQKDPVILTYSENPSSELSRELRRTMENINALAEICAESNGKLYEGEMKGLVEQLNTLYEEMLKAIKQVNKKSRKNYKQFYKEIYRRKEDIKSGKS